MAKKKACYKAPTIKVHRGKEFIAVFEDGSKESIKALNGKQLSQRIIKIVSGETGETIIERAEKENNSNEQ